MPRATHRWDERVEAWEKVAASDAFLEIRDRIVELADPSRDDLCVDLGAGTGLLTLALAPRVHRGEAPHGAFMAPS